MILAVYLGCYDDCPRVLEDASIQRTSLMTNELCRDHCLGENKLYALTEVCTLISTEKLVSLFLEYTVLHSRR